ncbi:MAG: leucyl aminopeptidase [Armatimonadetes bacterium]|nr:leucyl aminopeptidase [Armatimonadota bacterium]
MNFSVIQGSLTDQPSDILIVNLFQGVTEPGGATGAVDRALGGAISELIRDEEFEGSIGQTAVLAACANIPAKKVLLVGLGKREEFGIQAIMRAAASAGRKCRSLRARTVSSILHGAGVAGMPPYDCAKATILGTILGTYEYTRLKTENVKPNTIDQFNIVELSAEKMDSIERGTRLAETLGDAIVFARDLGNEPSNVVTPSYLAELAQEIARDNGMQCRVRDRAEIEEAGMGLIAAVARGSAVEPRFIEIRYESPGASKTVAIIGKGVTFDSGGYSLKPHDSMYGMKDDMSGAADVLATMRAIGKLKPKVNVVALIPSVENMIGGRAIHPGDVFKSYSGKTVEINNTDAEGRLILADAIAYARHADVDEIVDLATLTGACVVALGREIAGIFGNNDSLAESLLESGESCGEKMWRLPLHAGYKEHLKSDVADLKNTGPREAAAINGALFLESFVGDTPWAHIDLSSATIDKDADLAKKGSTGMGTGTLIEYLLK